jgi:hypothetical protein
MRRTCSRMHRSAKSYALKGEAIHPSPMTTEERLDDVARLLALGYLRLRARRVEQKANDPNHLREFGLDFAAEGSVGDTDAHAHRESRCPRLHPS